MDEPLNPAAAESESDESIEAVSRPPFQIVRALAAVALTAAGFGLYRYVLMTFWSSPAMGVHLRTPYPAFFALALAMVLAATALLIALSLASPHARLSFGLLAFMACATIGIDGGRFVSYLVRGTRNPPFALKLRAGDAFPKFTLVDQNGASISGPASDKPTLVVIYRGDFCPYARYELSILTDASADFDRAGIRVIAISADTTDRSAMLSKYLRTSIPLLSDSTESVLRPLGLVQKHVNGEPDNAIPAYVVVDRDGVVRWIFTSAYYRELPEVSTLLAASRAAISASPAQN